MARRRRRDRFRGYKETVTRPAALGKLAVYYFGRFSKYPETVRVSFANGATAVYYLRSEIPRPVFPKRSRHEVIGYQWRGGRSWLNLFR